MAVYPALLSRDLVSRGGAPVLPGAAGPAASPSEKRACGPGSGRRVTGGAHGVIDLARVYRTAGNV